MKSVENMKNDAACQQGLCSMCSYMLRQNDLYWLFLWDHVSAGRLGPSKRFLSSCVWKIWKSELHIIICHIPPLKLIMMGK